MEEGTHEEVVLGTLDSRLSLEERETDEDTSDEEHDWMLTDSGEEVGASDSDYDDNSEYDSSDD